MKTYKVHLIRHGRENPDNVIRYTGRTDSPLTEKGIEEIKELDSKGIYPYGEVFYTSPLTRCIQTLNLIYPDQRPIIAEGLAECNFGEFEGKTAEELKDDPRYPDWLSGGTPPGGENTEKFVKRTVVTFAMIVEDLMKTGTTDCVVCTHGGSIMALLSTCGLPEMPFNQWFCKPGHGYTLRITPSVWMRGYKAEVIAEI